MQNQSLIICTFVFVLLVAATTGAEENDPCCSFPCQNDGICLSKGNNKDFTCDCTGLEYYGKTCETPFFTRRVKNMLRPSAATINNILTGAPWLWKIINNVPFLHRAAMLYIYTSRGAAVDTPPRYNSGHDYITTESHFDTSYYARSLPPVPQHCPTPMGVAGKKVLPDIDYLAERFFKRRQFIPEPHGTNVFFSYYAQHFNHQYLRTDKAKGPGFKLGGDGVDVSHIYGLGKPHQDALRSFIQGKMKVRIIDGEQFPPLLRDAPTVHMIYPPHTPEHEKVALGHPLFSIQPGMYVMSTIWLREHNRICDILMAEHPDWDDERLYQTAKLIVLAENLKITVEEYVKHLSQYNVKLTYDPDLLRDSSHNFQYSNRIHLEFNQLYHWHPMAPDSIEIDNSTYTIQEMSFSLKTVNEHGLEKFVDAISKQPAGALSHHNHGPAVLDTFKQVVRQGRELRMQSFNNYRLKFGMPKYKSFFELTGDAAMSAELEQLYGHIDALEFYPGLLLEKIDRSVTPFTMVNIGGPYAVKGMMANPISSPHYWKPSTFGGDVGFNIAKTTTIKDLFCRNMKMQECNHIGFKIPSGSVNYQTTLQHIEPSPMPSYATPLAVTSSQTFSPPAGTTYATNYRPLTVDDLDFLDCQSADLSQWTTQQQRLQGLNNKNCPQHRRETH